MSSWTWSIEHHKDGYSVALVKRPLRAHVLTHIGGHLLRYGLTYRLGDAMIDRWDNDDETVMRLAITEEQAQKLGWDLV
jgi:hypothetical protein